VTLIGQNKKSFAPRRGQTRKIWRQWPRDSQREYTWGKCLIFTFGAQCGDAYICEAAEESPWRESSIGNKLNCSSGKYTVHEKQRKHVTFHVLNQQKIRYCSQLVFETNWQYVIADNSCLKSTDNTLLQSTHVWNQPTIHYCSQLVFEINQQYVIAVNSCLKSTENTLLQSTRNWNLQTIRYCSQLVFEITR